MNSARFRCAAASLGGKLFAIGADVGRGGSNSVEVYDPSTNKWSYIASMSSKRFALAATSLGGRL